MTKMTRPPIFKIQTAPKATAVQKIAKTGNYRGSPRERGYSSKWDRLSIAYRKRHPFCEWCSQEGKDALTDLVDHMIPVVDRPDLILDWKNLWGICSYHHGIKARLEEYARENDQIHMLPTWCKESDKRPLQFRPMFCDPIKD